MKMNADGSVVVDGVVLSAEQVAQIKELKPEKYEFWWRIRARACKPETFPWQNILPELNPSNGYVNLVGYALNQKMMSGGCYWLECVISAGCPS